MPLAKPCVIRLISCNPAEASGLRRRNPRAVVVLKVFAGTGTMLAESNDGHVQHA